MWLGQLFVIPQTLQGYPLAGLALRLALTWWAEDTQIFVNGQLVQEGDLFDCSARVLLSEAAVPGEKISVALRLVSPGHDIGALMRSCCVYESTDSIDRKKRVSSSSLKLRPNKRNHQRILPNVKLSPWKAEPIQNPKSKIQNRLTDDKRWIYCDRYPWGCTWNNPLPGSIT